MPYRDVIAALERSRCDPQGSGGQHKARCPVHRGDNKSLSVDLRGDKTLLRCWARGCDFKSISAALRLSESMFFETERLQGGRYPVSQRKKGDSMGKKPGFDEPTLEQIAAKSGVTVGHLRSLGWSEGTGECEGKKGMYTVTGCRVPYYRRVAEGEEGSVKLDGVAWPVIETFAKVRASLEGDPKYVAEKRGVPLQLYGEWLLDGYRARPKPSLIFVEGETDTAALTFQGLPVAGIPGTGAVEAVLRADHLEGFDRLFLIREPGNEDPKKGDSGLKFCQNFAKHLPVIGWNGPVKVIELPEKDPAAMLKARGQEGFLPAFREAAKSGVSLNKIFQDEEIKGLIQWGDKVKMRPVRYLMYPALPAGKLTLWCGSAGLGKSFSMMALAAAITRGEVLENCDPERSELGDGRVLVFSGEDELDDTLAPRLTVCGGDLSKLAVYDTHKHRVTFADIEHLRKVVDAIRPSLIFFDPISRFWPGGVSQNDQDTVAPLLEPICDLGAPYGAAVVLVGWSSKGKKDSALDAVFGSVVFSGSARSVWTITPADDDAQSPGVRRAIVAHAKCNHAAMAASIKYEITGDPYGLSPVQKEAMSLEEVEAVNRAGSFRWLGTVDVTADQAVTGKSRGNGVGTLGRAVQVMGELFQGREGVEIPVAEVIEAVNSAKCIDHYWAARMELQLQERKGPGGQLLFMPSEGQEQEQKEMPW